ncbi:unnamed protein product [Schistosoma margrebowiei]|uniref:Uncharacterized protein n=1 Tax=Schistosoma margrebowiei TaxID=48269 RepID=A0AA84ZAW6_9TREM|nr:unnamed protein product [Schistosoma margrebowiei]
MIIKAIVMLCLSQYLMCEVVMMSTQASSNIASDEVIVVKDTVTDDGEDSTSDDKDGNSVINLMLTLIVYLRDLFGFCEDSTPSYNTTMGV